MMFIDEAARKDEGGNMVASKEYRTAEATLQEEIMSTEEYDVIKISPLIDWRHRAGGEIYGEKRISSSLNNKSAGIPLELSERDIGGVGAL